MQRPERKYESGKTRNLILGLLFDALGMLSFSLPLIGDFADVVWAPLSGILMTRLYKGMAGRTAAGVSALEELLPFTDFVPSFTLMWAYTYLWKGKNRAVKPDYFSRKTKPMPILLSIFLAKGKKNFDWPKSHPKTISKKG